MSDIKTVLSLLCQHLKLSISVAMKSEYFRLAKFGDTASNVSKIFWKVLNVLSYHAIKEKEVEIDFQQCDTVWATKLYFAYLQYTAIEFYALSEDSENSRQLLLAFAWLLGTQDVLSIITRTNVSASVVGRECSQLKSAEKAETMYDAPETLIAQINSLLHLNGKVNYNVKEISKLVSERANLISKVHTASINVGGLPHLSVSELALFKRIATINKDTPTEEDKKYLEELFRVGCLVDTHMKWLRKQYIFFDWMVTVVEEHNKFLSSGLNDINWNEVSKFIFLLHRLIQEKLETLSSKESTNSQDYKMRCISRFLRSPSNSTQMENWLAEVSTELKKETEDLSEKKEKLSKKLKEMLRSIPSCVQV